ncbi:MAG: hypothetical protein GY701_12940, partial [Sulfitobacter sp.]|nr:hypothetical protein [Sulfitobacter sp.]
GGGVYSITFQAPEQYGDEYFNGKFTSVSTIISGNTATTANDVTSTNGLFANYSLLGTGVGGIDYGSSDNNQSDDDPGLQALTDNGCAVEAGDPGGSTECVKTMELNTTSPAIDKGSNPLSLGYDERGNVARSIDGNLDPADSPDYAQTDIGAYELQLQDFGDAPSTYG